VVNNRHLKYARYMHLKAVEYTFVCIIFGDGWGVVEYFANDTHGTYVLVI
jgi:hypothetical protein